MIYALVGKRPFKLQNFHLPQSNSVPNQFFHPIHSNPGQTYSQPHDESSIWWRDGRFTFPSIYSGVFDNMKWIITFAPIIDRGVAQLASAHVWGTWGRKFESSHPDDRKVKTLYFKRIQGFFIGSGKCSGIFIKDIAYIPSFESWEVFQYGL